MLTYTTSMDWKTYYKEVPVSCDTHIQCNPVKAGLCPGTLQWAHMQGEGRVMVRTGHSFSGVAASAEGGSFSGEQVHGGWPCRLMHSFGGKI